MLVVNGLEEARAALKAGATQLASPPYAACHAGVGYHRALLDALTAEFTAQDFTYLLCCGDDAATAHQALRVGFTEIACAAPEALRAPLQALADRVGARLVLHEM